jgi:hypothetical protein
VASSIEELRPITIDSCDRGFRPAPPCTRRRS